MARWEVALEHYCTVAKGNGIDFYLIGSVTAAVRGVEIVPGDIDVVVDVADFWRAEAVFRQWVTQPFREMPPGEVIGLFGVARMDGVTVEISARPQNTYGRHPIEMLCWNGHIIKAQTLELLQRVYRHKERREYMEAIRRFLAQESI